MIPSFLDENNLMNYTDDNTPYDSNIDVLNDSLVHDTLIKWFNENYFEWIYTTLLIMKMTCKIDEVIIRSVTTRHNIDNKHDFNEHISRICKKVTLKLHALSRILYREVMNSHESFH